MTRAVLQGSEGERLGELYAYDVLDSAQEESFDELVRFAAELFEMPVARINLIDADRQWTKADVGGLALECAREDSFCAQAILDPDEVLAIPDALADPRFASASLVVGDPHIRFYAGAPLVTPRGHAVGALCVVDFVPRQLTPHQREQLRVLARQVVMQLELRQRLADQRAEAEGLRELDRLRNSFVSTVVHEFRNPLTAIYGFGRTLSSGKLGPLAGEQAAAVEAIEDGAARLNGLVDELLGTSELLSGVIRLELKRTDLAGLVHAAVGRARAAASEDVTFQVDAPGLAAVTCDERRVGQVLDNLLSNAVKYTPAGGTVTVRALAEPGSCATVTVADTGIGVPEPELPKLFSPFYRASTATASSIPGTGLGLCVVKAIVEAHGGSVHVRSATGEGTEVTIDLPASPER